jgi:hypothetical protein
MLIDAELGVFEGRIYREASEEFWRYVAVSAKLGSGTTVDHASRVAGLAKSQIRRLATLHWLLSAEVDEFLQALPQVLARLSRTTAPVSGEGQEVRGAVDWGATLALRASSGCRMPTFAYVEAQAKNDTAANRVLKTMLQWIVSAAKSLTAVPSELADDREEADRWVSETVRRAGIAIRALRHPGLRAVRAPERLSEHDLRACSAEPVRGYRRAVEAARLRRALIEREDTEAICAMLRKRLLIPAQKFRLFEIWILARIARYFREQGCEQFSVPLLGDGQSVPVYRFRRDGIPSIDVFFQGVPVTMRNFSSYREIFEAYSLDVGSRTPDIVIQRGSRADAMRLIVEAKASDDSRYIADGVYKVLGYAADFVHALPPATSGSPVGLLVTKTRPHLLPGAQRQNHRVWIATIESLDATLPTLLGPFLEI